MRSDNEIRHEAQARSGDRTLGEAANRWVTWQIVMGIIGLAIFLLILLLFFLPMWRRFPMPL